MFCLVMLRIAIELTMHDKSYEDIASKFFEHFLYIASAMNRMGDGGLWDEEDGFYYDRLLMPDGRKIPMRVRSLVGLIPLFAVATLDADALDRMPDFQRRMLWFIKHRPDLCFNIASITRHGQDERTAAFTGAAFTPRTRAAVYAGRERVSVTVRHSRRVALSPGPPVHLAGGRSGVPRELRAGGIQNQLVRGKFQLARAGLVSGKLSDDGIAAALPSLLWRRIAGRVSHRFRRKDASGGRGAPTVPHGYRIFSCGTSTDAGRSLEERRNSRAIRFSAITFCFMNTSTAIMARV